MGRRSRRSLSLCRPVPAEQARLAEQHRRTQALIAAALTRDLARLWRALFRPANPGPSWRAVRMAAAALVRDRRGQSAVVAGRYYRQARTAASAAGRVRIASPMDLPEERLLANLDATGIGSYSRAVRAGATPTKGGDAAAVNLSGAGTRLVLEGGRSVVAGTAKADSEAIGWARVTDADPCSWCLMLASRGAVYRSAATAGRLKNDRFVGDGQFKWHDHCGCSTVIVWDPQDPVLDRADDLYDRWQSVTSGFSGNDAVTAWRRYWEAKQSGQPEAAARQTARTGGR
jgi:hypothetical protein